ncbi:MAG: succinate dehydrogenase/fumarate reductase flavoprotein subunit [Psychromonas sp.]|jgi:succinate dehydrogenase/fumarate reductase flavoprotein subunit
MEITNMNEKMNLSRRQFIGITGGIIGASALAAAMPLGAAPTQNKTKINSKDFKVEQQETDVLVIGAGFAGLFAAVKAHDAGAKVMMVSKGGLGTSGLTPFAKGIFSYDQNTAKMSIDEFVAKVSDSAIGTNNPVFTRQLAEHSYDRVQELKSWGFFDSPLCRTSFIKPVQERNITLVERVMMTHLLKENGRVVGASGFSLKENKIIHFKAKTVVLCTGSGGFKPNGFPMCDLTHDGTIMAYNIGAKITGKEWNDGHPASAKNSGSCYDNWHGQIEEKPSTTSAEIHHDLGIETNYQAYTVGAPVTMGPGNPDQKITKIVGGPYTPPAFQRQGMSAPPQQKGGLFSIFSSSKGHSGPPGMGGEQVGGSTAGMAIHKSEGLVPIDENGLTTIPGLYAAGDALGSYMSGGIYTQIGGSAAGSAVQGTFAGEAAAEASKVVQSFSVSDTKLAEVEAAILAPLKRKTGYSPAWVTQVLQGIMIPNFVLYIKKERMMQGALAYVEELKEHHVPMLMAEDRHTLRLAHETENMIITAEMKLKASLMRTESRCSHYRLDYPDIDYKNWQAWINISKDNKGEMIFEKQPFDLWPKFS